MADNDFNRNDNETVQETKLQFLGGHSLSNRDIINDESEPDEGPSCNPCCSLTSKLVHSASQFKTRKLFIVFWLIIRLLLFITFLYFFVCALSLMSDAFRLLAGNSLAAVFRNNELLKNPIVDLMIGVLVTMTIHSSSTTTAIMISMASSGSIGVDQAIFVVFGAEIGTSVTSTLVAIAHIRNREDFKKAFSGATIQSVYNWLCILLFFPLEVGTHVLRTTAEAIVRTMHVEGGAAATEFLNKIIRPLTSKIIQLDKNQIKQSINGNGSLLPLDNITSFIQRQGQFMFSQTTLSDRAVGGILLAIALATVLCSLSGVAKTMHSLFAHQFSNVIRRYINSDLPGRWKPLTGYLFILIGAGMTLVIQSSTIFTSTLTPMVAVGLISVDRVFPLILGANIGTTGDSVLAALAQDAQVVRVALTVALVQVLFNVLGVLVFYPVPFMRLIVIDTGKWLGKQTHQYRWFAIVYVVALFLILPLFTIGLSMLGSGAFYAIFGPMALITVTVAVINALQTQAPRFLPRRLRDWMFLPAWLRSLEPYDRWISTKFRFCTRCCKSEQKEDRVDMDEEGAENGFLRNEDNRTDINAELVCTV